MALAQAERREREFFMTEMWKAYPHIWETKASYFTWLRGALRRCWNKSPAKIEFINANRIKIENSKGKMVWGGKCALCGEMFIQSQLQVDHAIPAGSLQDVSDIEGFVTRLLMSDALRFACIHCNSALSYADKYGVSYEEAVITKRAIALQNDKKDVQWLQERGTIPNKNAKSRRKQIIEKMKEEKE